MDTIKRALLLPVIMFCSAAFGQQNLFNVPSSDITLKGEPFFQQQVNLYSSEVQFNSTFCWGLGKRTEIGFNVLELNVRTHHARPILDTHSDNATPPVYPLYLVNFQKAFVINKAFKLGLGTQCGISKGSHPVNYSYANLVTAIPSIHTKVITGLYGGTDSYLGAETRWPTIGSHQPIGYQLGVEVQLLPEKLSLIAEDISGKHSLGEASVGAAYFLSPSWILSGAYLHANSSSGENAVVAEFTYSPSSKVHLRLFRHGHRARVT